MKTLSPLLIWLQEAATNIWRLLLGIVLLIVGIGLLAIVVPVAAAFYFITIGKKKQNAGEILVSNGKFYKLVAIGIDLLGNIIGGSFFNWLLLKKESQFPFGISGQTISSVIQWNFLINNLSEWGMNLKHDLDTIEFDHCEISLKKDIEKAEKDLANYHSLLTQFEITARTQKFLSRYN